MVAPTLELIGLDRDRAYDGLLAHKAKTFPRHTNRNAVDPVNQMLALYADVFNASMLALNVAASVFSPETMLTMAHARALASINGERLAKATAAAADLVSILTVSPTSPTQLLIGPSGAESGSLFGVLNGAVYEYLGADVTADAAGSNEIITKKGSTYAVESGSFSPFSATPLVNDALYIGHNHLMADSVQFAITAGAAGLTYSVENYDPISSAAPNSVVAQGGNLWRHSLTSYLGTVDRTGLSVTITLDQTGATETATVAFAGGVNYVDVGALSQSTVSLTASDYSAHSDWVPVPDLVDTTTGLSVSGSMTWSTPWTTLRSWTSTTINGVAGWFVRVRVTSVSGPTVPTLSLSRKTNDVWSLQIPVTQGQHFSDTLGTTDGRAFQKLYLNTDEYIEGSLTAVTVGADTYDVVDSLLDYTSTSKVVRLYEDADGKIYVQTGDNISGVIPAAGLTVTGVYRVGATGDGNAAAGTIVENTSGSQFLGSIRNPKDAIGWAAPVGGTGLAGDVAFERLRHTIPAAIRTKKHVAVAPADYELHAETYYLADGAGSPVSRAQAIEWSTTRTLRLICLGKGATALSAAQITDLEIYYNGTTVNLQRFGGVAQANTRVVVDNATLITVPVTATIYVPLAYSAVAESQVQSAVTAYLHPEAKDAAGAYVHTFGGKITLFDLKRIIANTIPLTADTVMSLPAADVVLVNDELSIAGAVSITVVAVS